MNEGRHTSYHMNPKKLNRLGTIALLCVLTLTTISCQSRHHRMGPLGWRPIFDGINTEGWQMIGPGELKLEDSELVTYGGMGLLWFTKEKFANCRIRVVFKPTMAN